MLGVLTVDALQLKGGKCCIKFLRKSNVYQRKFIIDSLCCFTVTQPVHKNGSSHTMFLPLNFLSRGPRLLSEEEEKMKALMSLQEEQEEYILKTQREKQELKQEMEAKSRALEEAQRQLEEVRANRHRVDLDVVVRGTPSVSNTSFVLLC